MFGFPICMFSMHKMYPIKTIKLLNNAVLAFSSKEYHYTYKCFGSIINYVSSIFRILMNPIMVAMSFTIFKLSFILTASTEMESPKFWFARSSLGHQFQTGSDMQTGIMVIRRDDSNFEQLKIYETLYFTSKHSLQEIATRPTFWWNIPKMN